MNGFPKPSKLLDRIVTVGDGPIAIALCPDFETGLWRYKALAEHLFDWLPDVALRPNERRAILYEPNKQLARSCRRMFDTDDASQRGEVGEILLHAACRQEFETVPFIARLFYKMRTNDSVTSVDVVHVLRNEETTKLELWFGEAKLYDNMQDARYKALSSVKPLWDKTFLTELKALVGPKIEADDPYSEELSWMFEEETSLDQIITRIVIPICIAADFPATASAGTRTPDYIAAVAAELETVRNYFSERVPAEVAFVVILIPLDSKEKLENAVNARVRSYLE